MRTLSSAVAARSSAALIRSSTARALASTTRVRRSATCARCSAASARSLWTSNWPRKFPCRVAKNERQPGHDKRLRATVSAKSGGALLSSRCSHGYCCSAGDRICIEKTQAVLLCARGGVGHIPQHGLYLLLTASTVVGTRNLAR